MLSSFAGSYFASRRNMGLITSGLTLNIDASQSASYGGSGTTWTDIAGVKDNITLTGSPTFTSGNPAYFTFNGSSQYGTGSATNILPTTAYTKSVWFYVNANADNNLVSSSGGGHFMYLFSSNKIYCGHANWGNYLAYPSTGNISLSTWYNTTLTFSTTNGMTLYINGVQDSTYTANKAAHGGNGAVNIACFSAGGNLFNGRISQVLCYNRELNANEVAYNYIATKSKFGL